MTKLNENYRELQKADSLGVSCMLMKHEADSTYVFLSLGSINSSRMLLMLLDE